jgi:hypothetical protein
MKRDVKSRPWLPCAVPRSIHLQPLVLSPSLSLSLPCKIVLVYKYSIIIYNESRGASSARDAIGGRS